MTRFDIDMAKCMYCGLCSEPCPTGSIHHTPEFEGADYSLESMVRKFVKTPVLAYKPKKGGETDPEIAPILERGMRYIGEFASAEGGGGEEEGGRGLRVPSGSLTGRTRPVGTAGRLAGCRGGR